MLKCFFERVLMPGVAFDITDPKNVKPVLTPIKRISAVVTYGRPLWTALLTGGRTSTSCYAQYHMNVATPERLNAFKLKVSQAMLRLA